MPKLKEAAGGVRNNVFLLLGLFAGRWRGEKALVLLSRTGLPTLHFWPRTWDRMRVQEGNKRVGREHVLGGKEAYNSKLQPLGTYWQLNHVAEVNQTYATMGNASPKCANTQESVYSANSPYLYVYVRQNS